MRQRGGSNEPREQSVERPRRQGKEQVSGIAAGRAERRQRIAPVAICRTRCVLRLSCRRRPDRAPESSNRETPMTAKFAKRPEFFTRRARDCGECAVFTCAAGPWHVACIRVGQRSVQRSIAIYGGR